MPKSSKFTDFSMVGLDGKKTKLSKIAGRGKPVVVVVYSPDLPACASALQAVEEHAFSKDHIDFVLLDVSGDLKANREFLIAQGIRKCLPFTGRIPKGYDIREGALPFHIVIDEDGKLLLASEDATEEYIELVA